MNSIERLQDEFGILVTWKDNRPYFSGVGKHLIAEHACGANIYAEISALMKDVEDNWKTYQQKDERIVVKLPRQILVLYPSEILKCVVNNEDIYTRALKRGKSESRYIAQERRY